MSRISVLTVLGSTALGFAALILVAIRKESFTLGVREMLSGVWGVVTMVDLSIGLVLVAVWIAVLEDRWRTAIPWIFGVVCLGNLTTLVYLMWRAVRQPNMRAIVVPVRWL